jgi:hypothetical protein
MDLKLTRAVSVLDALGNYFESLETYLKQTDRDKFTRLERGLAECRQYKRKLEQIKLDDDGLFQAVHLHASVRRLLEGLYTMLDFELPVGEEISKTRAFRLSEVFNQITKVYRTYIRDVAAEASEVVMTASQQLKVKNPLELQSLWQKWPNSIDLYTLAQTSLLNQSYRDRDRDRQQQIFEIIESDKRFILREQTWISPFLTFNCVPWVGTPLPVPWDAVVKALEANERARTQKELAPSPEESKESCAARTFSPDMDGSIVITRCIGQATVVHELPRGLTWGPGILESDIHNTLVPISESKWQWDIKVTDSTATIRYYIFERMGDDLWRILVPWKFPRPDVPRDLLVHKIKERAFGRPNAYHELLERPLREHLSKRVAVLASEEARPQDVSLSVLRVTDQLMALVKADKGKPLDRLDNEKLDRIFETAVLEELSKHDLHLLDAVLYWTDWMRRDFRRDLDATVEKMLHEKSDMSDFSEWSAVAENRVEKIVHHAVESQLRKTGNVFQDLFDKQHKINEVRTHTRRNTS